MARVGVLGGSFNPPHVAHLRCASGARSQLGLERVLLVPARVPPHKRLLEDPGPRHRLAMCRLAAAEHSDWLSVSEMELRRDGPSYTSDTLREIDARQPGDELTFILGGDMALSLPSWHDPQAILSLASLAVVERAGASRSDVRARLKTLVSDDGRLEFIDIPRLEVSSSEIRRRVRQGEPIDELVPETVGSYIAREGLYA
jgi:nicotinate-nucleotide adenylyltransferase